MKTTIFFPKSWHAFEALDWLLKRGFSFKRFRVRSGLYVHRESESDTKGQWAFRHFSKSKISKS